MSDGPIIPEPAAPSHPGADESRVAELDRIVCALMDRMTTLEATVKALELEIV